jgi:hypothetical protein
VEHPLLAEKILTLSFFAGLVLQGRVFRFLISSFPSVLPARPCSTYRFRIQGFSPFPAQSFDSFFSCVPNTTPCRTLKVFHTKRALPSSVLRIRVCCVPDDPARCVFCILVCTGTSTRSGVRRFFSASVLSTVSCKLSTRSAGSRVRGEYAKRKNLTDWKGRA